MEPDMKEDVKEADAACAPGCCCCGDADGTVVTDDVRSPEGVPPVSCGPGCDCAKPATHRTARTIISLMVLAAVAVIIVIKLTGCAGGQSPAGTASAINVDKVGQKIAKLADVKTVGQEPDVAFVVMPEAGKNTISSDIPDAVTAAAGKIKAQGMTTGVFVLDSASADYAQIAKDRMMPAVTVINKGHGQQTVNSTITESTLIQGYVMASRSSGTTAPSGKSGGGCGCGGGGGGGGASTCGGGN